MSVVVNNSTMATTGTGGALAVTVSTIDGNGIIAGDIIVANCLSNGTHVSNSMAVQDSVNAVSFTNGKEQQLGGASAKWQQVLYYQAAANVPDGSAITLTPYASATITGLAVTVIRYVTGTVANAFVSQGNAASTSQVAPALGAAPTLGQFVMTFDAADSGTLTPGVAFTADSSVVGASCSLANACATANGVSTFASTWTDTASAVSAAMTVAFTFAGVGIPYKIGSTAQAAGSASTVVTVTTTSIANDALFCVAGIGTATVTPTGVTDSKGHTWTLLGSFTAASGMSCYIYQSLHAATTLVPADTVTVAWSGTTFAKNCEVIGCSGVNATVALDQTATASGSGTAPAATSGALANNNELALAVITSGSLSAGITWPAGVALDAGIRASGGVYTSVGGKVVTSASPVSLGATLGASAVWAELLVTLLPDPPAGAGATITVTNATPLPPGQVGVAYTTQLAATGGAPPYTWSVTSGAVPAGLTLASGSGGGSAADFTYVGVNTGPQGAPTLAGFTAQYPTIGPVGCYKFFFNDLPASWTGTLMDQITTSKPGVFCYIAWNTQHTAAQINNFIQSIPHSIPAVGFTWQSEVENGPVMSASAFQSGWASQSLGIQAAQANTPVKLVTLTSCFMGYYQTGPGDSAFIPPPQYTDVYGIDFYDRKIYWVGPDLSTNKAWTVWTAHVKGFGKPLALTEYGISGAGTDAAQNTRLQADWAYLKTAFGPGGSVSQLPLYVWLYWNTASGGINDFLGAATKATWKGIAGTQAGSAAAAGGTGGLLAGTPTTAGTSTPTIRATDSAAATGSKAFTLVISGSSALAVTSTSLPGGTAGTPYGGGQLSATGGTTPYTWSLQSGTLPAGLAIVGQSITGTPTANGTSAFVLKVTDNVAATATASVSIVISSALSVTTAALPAGQVGAAYAFTLATANGTPPYTWAVTGTLPPGIVLDTVGGVLSGTPTVPASAPVSFTVTDGASATATSVPLTLAIASSTGGLPPLGRRRFGGTTGDWAFTFVGDAIDRAAGVTVTFYTALTGGTQIVDLTTAGGGPITSVLTDSSGEMPEFFGPSGVMEMYADANGGLGPRRRMVAADMGDAVSLLWTAVTNLGG